MYELGAGMSVDKTAYHHDVRSGKIPNNVDPNRIGDNVILIDEIQGRTIDEWIDDTMQPHIDAYNEKQKRSDRKINTGYVEWHNSNGNYTQNKKTDHVRIAAEFVLSYGGHDDIGGEYFSPLTSPQRKQEIYNQAVRLFTKWTEDMERDYPHIKIGLAVIHADEPNGSIHLHGIVIPQAEYSRGLPVQCCWSRALAQDGIEAIKDKDLAKEAGGFQLTRFYKQFRTHMEKDLIKEGFTIKEEQHGKDHLNCDQYREVMTAATQAAQQITEEAQKKVEAIDLLQSELEEIDRIERLPSYDPTKVKHVQVKTGFMKSEEMVQMPVDVFESLREGIDSRSLNRDTEEKVKRQKETFSKVIKASMTPKEEALQRKVTDLKAQLEDKTKKLEQAETVIKQKTRLIEKLESIIESVKDFLRDRGLLRIFEQSQERNDRTR